MAGNQLAAKVLIQLRILHALDDGSTLQRVATVYIRGHEYRVYAPSKATGNPLDWLDHLVVHQPSPFGFGGELSVEATTGIYILKLVKEELEKLSKETNAPQGGMDTGEPLPEALRVRSVVSYYHVRLHILDEANIEVKFDLTRTELERRILEPYRNLQPVVIGGRTITIERVARLEIFETPYPSSRFAPMTPTLTRSVREDPFHGEPDVRNVTDDLITTPSLTVLPQRTDAVELLCSRFHLVAKQLRERREDRPTLDVKDEYDVQDLLHALLRIFFEDVRPEEPTPSFAGKASRMDFLLPTEHLVVEAKRSRQSLGARELGSELIDDIARYKKHPLCKKLICFVYDPEGYIANPRGIEGDLSRTEDDFEVKVIVVP